MQYENRRMEIRAKGTLGVPLQKVSKKGVSDTAIGFRPSSEKVASSSNEPSNVDIENYVSSIVGIHTIPINDILRDKTDTFKSF